MCFSIHFSKRKSLKTNLPEVGGKEIRQCNLLTLKIFTNLNYSKYINVKANLHNTNRCSYLNPNFEEGEGGFEV